MKPETYKTESTRLIVTGHLWSGHGADHEYGVPEGSEPTTLAEAARLAPDFARLESAELVTVCRTITETTERKALK